MSQWSNDRLEKWLLKRRRRTTTTLWGRLKAHAQQQKADKKLSICRGEMTAKMKWKSHSRSGRYSTSPEEHTTPVKWQTWQLSPFSFCLQVQSCDTLASAQHSTHSILYSAAAATLTKLFAIRVNCCWCKAIPTQLSSALPHLYLVHSGQQKCTESVGRRCSSQFRGRRESQWAKCVYETSDWRRRSERTKKGNEKAK